jgi:uncharacterized protein (DUF3084 family)
MLDNKKRAGKLRTSKFMEKVEDRKKKVWDLYLAGTSYREIAKQLAISKSLVGEYINETLENLQKESLERGRKYVEIELIRLEELFQAWFPRAIAEATTQRGPLSGTRASEMVLKIMDRRARYLGLDAPIQVEDKNVSSLLSLIRSSMPKQVPTRETIIVQASGKPEPQGDVEPDVRLLASGKDEDDTGIE